MVLFTFLLKPLCAVYLSAATLNYWLRPKWKICNCSKEIVLFSKEVGGESVLIGTAADISVGRLVCLFHCVDPEVSFCSFSAYLVTSSRMGHRLRKTAATVNSAPTLEV